MEDTGTQLVREGRLIEGLRSLVERYVGAQDPGQTDDSFAAMTRHLRERIRVEEEALFPALERLVGGGACFEPTRRMRRQHAVLLDLVESLGNAITNRQWATASFDLRELQAALKLHLEEERRVLFPILGPDGGGHA
jgi:iron-sulfur cluster repair protein YtfE (RIC family)